jgi:hypothetical protein
MTWQHDVMFTHIKKARVYSLRAETLKRGWEPRKQMIVEVWHIEEAKRSGRPKISRTDLDNENKKTRLKWCEKHKDWKCKIAELYGRMKPGTA